MRPNELLHQLKNQLERKAKLFHANPCEESKWFKPSMDESDKWHGLWNITEADVVDSLASILQKEKWACYLEVPPHLSKANRKEYNRIRCDLLAVKGKKHIWVECKQVHDDDGNSLSKRQWQRNSEFYNPLEWDVAKLRVLRGGIKYLLIFTSAHHRNLDTLPSERTTKKITIRDALDKLGRNAKATYSRVVEDPHTKYFHTLQLLRFS